MLRIEHLSKAYGEKKAVDDLNLHIAPGEIYGFIGHNGAGKTTTLKSVAGILQFDAGGNHHADGNSIRTRAAGAASGSLAYIPDNPDLYDFMTGIKYLNFIADIFGVSAADRQDRIREYAGLFELTDDLAQPIAAYSHGMKQKLAIISAWLHRPRLILMDEPFVGLDPKAAHLLKGMMREVCDEGGAIFFSTHVLEVAEKLCDKVAIIKGGKAHPLRHHGGGQGRRLPGGRVPGTGGRIMLKLLAEKAADGDLPHLFLRRQEEQGPLHRLAIGPVYRAVRPADGGHPGRHVHPAVRDALRRRWQRRAWAGSTLR